MPRERLLTRPLLRMTKAALSSFALAAVCGGAAASAQTPPSERPRQQQQQPPSPASPAARAGSAAEADLSITARVTARELRFEKVPNPQVEFTGRPRRETVW